MFVSLLQLMGFAPAKPVHSRAEENPLPVSAKSAVKLCKASLSDVAALPQREPAPEIPQQLKPVRRPIVKTPAVKTTTVKPVASTPKVTVATKPKKAEPAIVSKPVKVVVKTLSKASAPAVVKSIHPPVQAKPVAPLAVKKPGKVQTPVPTPPPSLPKKSVSVTIKTKTPSPVATPAPSPVKPVVPVVAEPNLSASGVPVRSGRPSSRLAQLTVPSMAQSVASTAAKASFTQITTVQPIVSPLASAVKKDPKLANNWKNKPLAQLTDADVIAMSDDDYMNDTQLAFFRLKLVTLKDDMLRNAGETTEHLREDTVVVPDPTDRATIEEEHALELRTRDRERKLLKKIEQSIVRIDAGDYGYCDETGESIGVGRLLARPTATLSLEAQQRRELKQKMFGD
jgi:DnaK suppressor protein